MSLTLESAQKLVARATAKATSDFKRPICVSVCDEFGFQLAFGRMDGAPVRSIWISQQKAFTAARIGVSTDVFFARVQKENLDPTWFGEGIVPLPGGSPVKDKAGKLVGAIGVSGLAVHEDHAISDAMAALASSESA